MSYNTLFVNLHCIGSFTTRDVFVLAQSVSPHVIESTKVLDSGSQPPRFRIPASGFWIPTFWIPDSNLLDSGFHTKAVDSGFQTIVDLWIPDSNSKNLLDSGFRFSYMGRVSAYVWVNGICQFCQWIGNSRRYSWKSRFSFLEINSSLLLVRGLADAVHAKCLPANC